LLNLPIETIIIGHMNKLERTVLSIHIEKTGGTSLGEYYSQLFGAKGVYVYKPSTNDLVPYSPMHQVTASEFGNKIRKRFAGTPLYAFIHKFTRDYLNYVNHISIQNIPNMHLVIHGHFPANKFDGLVDKPFYTVILRDPLERMKSHYNHWKLAKGKVDQRLQLSDESVQTFEDFAFHAMLKNWQSSYLVGKPIDQFDLVGVSTALENFTQEFVYRLGITGTTQRVKSLNETPIYLKKETDDLIFNQSFLPKFMKFHADDYDNYQKAKEATLKYTTRS